MWKWREGEPGSREVGAGPAHALHRDVHTSCDPARWLTRDDRRVLLRRVADPSLKNPTDLDVAKEVVIRGRVLVQFKAAEAG